MRFNLAVGVCFAASLTLTACATRADYHLLDAGARQHIKTVDGVLIASQKQIGADISQGSRLSNLATFFSGSPIPMLVEAGVAGVRTIEANKLAKPMRETLGDHDYAWEFRKQVKQSLARTTLSDLDQLDKMTIIREDYPGLRASLIEKSDADAVLVVDMKYAFTPKFDRLYVASYAMLFPNTEALKRFQETPDKDNIIEFSDNLYRNQFAASLSVAEPSSSRTENAAYWAEVPRDTLIDALERVGLSLVDALANDINLDDLDSDLDLIPEGYVLNTEYSNLNSLLKENESHSDAERPSSDIELSPEDAAVLPKGKTPTQDDGS